MIDFITVFVLRFVNGRYARVVHTLWFKRKCRCILTRNSRIYYEQKNHKNEQQKILIESEEDSNYINFINIFFKTLFLREIKVLFLFQRT